MRLSCSPRWAEEWTQIYPRGYALTGKDVTMMPGRARWVAVLPEMRTSDDADRGREAGCSFQAMRWRAQYVHDEGPVGEVARLRRRREEGPCRRTM